eukprot:366083-Chlamydomonas_euryale.AAC.5
MLRSAAPPNPCPPPFTSAGALHGSAVTRVNLRRWMRHLPSSPSSSFADSCNVSNSAGRAPATGSTSSTYALTSTKLGSTLRAATRAGVEERKKA